MGDFASYQSGVERMLAAGNRFSEIEDYITAAPLREECKAALWLLAWAHQEPRAQLRLAKETLALVRASAPTSLAGGRPAGRPQRGPAPIALD